MNISVTVKYFFYLLLSFLFLQKKNRNGTEIILQIKCTQFLKFTQRFYWIFFFTERKMYFLQFKPNDSHLFMTYGTHYKLLFYQAIPILPQSTDVTF